MTKRIEQQEAQEEKEREWLASPQARAERKDSQTAHDDLSDAAAVDLFRSKFGSELKPPVPDAETLLGGDRVKEFRGDYVAVTEGVGDKPARLIDSQVPLRTPGAGASDAPVDLDLVPDGGGYAADNGVAKVELPKQAGDGIRVGPVTVQPEGEAAVERIDSDTLAYPNLDTDTDLAVNVTPTGFETYHQLRGPDAPEAQRLRLALPAGTSLKAAGGGSAEVVRGDETMLTIRPPQAVDAQGREVPSSYEIDGDVLVIKTPHRDRSVAYPVLVDPEFEVKEDWACGWGSTNCTATWFHGNGYALDGLRYWDQYQDAPSGSYGLHKTCTNQWFFNNCYGPGNGGGSNWNIGCNGGSWSCGQTGLHINVHPNNWQGANGKIAEWYYVTPGSTTQIYRADFGAKFQRTRGTANPLMFTGIYSYADWNWMWGTAQNPGVAWFGGDVTHNWNANFGYHRPGPQAAAFGFTTNGAGANSAWRDAYMGAAIISLTDPDAPTFNGVNMTGPTTWTKDGTFTFAPSASDNGLGIRRFRLSAAGIADQDRWVWCSGAKSAPCLQTFALDPAKPAGDPYAPFRINAASLPDGQQNISIKASDALAGPSHDTTQSTTVKVDRTPPTVEALTGAVRDGAQLNSGQHSLAISAQDVGPGGAQNSGVKKFEYSMDQGAWQSKSASCDSGPCVDSFVIDTRPNTGVSEGAHNIRVRVADGVGQSSNVRAFNIVVDRTAPTLVLSGPLKEMAGQPVVDGTWTMGAEADDDDLGRKTSGVESVSVSVDGQPLKVDGDVATPLEQDCPEGNCLLDADVAYQTDQYPQGARSLTVTVRDGAGNLTEETLNFTSTRQDAPCESPSSMDVFNIGTNLASLVMNDATHTCSPTDPAARGLGAQHDITYIYGECADLPQQPAPDEMEGPCVPPLQVQVSPLCEKHAKLYNDDGTLGQYPYETTVVKGVPAASFDDGTILEIYTGNTTITIYGDSAERVSAAAAQLRPALSVDIPDPGEILGALSAGSDAVSVPPTLPPPNILALQQTEACS